MGNTRPSPGAAPDGLPTHPTLLEAALQFDRAAAAVLLVALPLAAWTWIVVMARDMYGPMTGASAWMMTTTWDVPHLLLLFAMWAVMMTAMMLPSASPLVLLYGAAARRSPQPGAAGHVYALAAGYLAVWGAFSAGATLLQRALASVHLVSPMMEATSGRAAAGLLFLAGAYQWTPLKGRCLRMCQSPLGFLIRGWRSGASGAFRLGAAHGAYCVGCCWALMLLLFAGGVMNLTVIVALTVFVGLEKLLPPRFYSARVSGAALMAAAVWLLLR